MKLEVGMYVRTQFGIDKVKDIILNGNLYEDSGLYLEKGKIILSKKAIKELKASHNIIDLIEVGDYVNGYQVTSKDQFLGFGNHDWYMLDNEIKSIVTKEQFESMQYEVK